MQSFMAIRQSLIIYKAKQENNAEEPFVEIEP